MDLNKKLIEDYLKHGKDNQDLEVVYFDDKGSCIQVSYYWYGESYTDIIPLFDLVSFVYYSFAEQFKNKLFMKTTVNVKVTIQMDVDNKGGLLANIKNQLDLINNGFMRDADDNFNAQIFVETVSSDDVELID
jgi:hypothetical protein